MKKLLIKAFKLVNKNLDIYLVSLLIFVVSTLTPRIGLLVVVMYVVQLGWSGTRIALLLDSHLNKKNWILNFGKYMWMYFKRLFPVTLVYLLIGIGMSIVWVTYLSKVDNISSILSNFPTKNNVLILAIALLLSPSTPFFNAFIPVVVFENTSFFKGISRTVQFLYNSKDLYLVLLGLSIVSLILWSINPLLFGSSIFSNDMKVYAVISTLIFTYLDLFIASLCLVYLSKTK